MYRGGRGGARGGAHAPKAIFGLGRIPVPDGTVTALEDQYQKTVKAEQDPPDLGAMSLDDNKPVRKAQENLALPARPSYGTQGRKITLWANYFQMIPDTRTLLHRHSIEVKKIGKEDGSSEGASQNAPSGKKLQRIIELLLEEPRISQYGDKIVTDFRSMLISTVPLDEIETTITYRAELEDFPPTLRQENYTIWVRHDGTVRIGDLTSYLTSTDTNATYPARLQTVQALNVFLRHYAKAHRYTAAPGKAKSFPTRPRDSENASLGAGLVAIRGFFSSVRLATARILVNINVSNGAFYRQSALKDTVQSHGKENGIDLKKLQSFLKLVRVRTTHLENRSNKLGEDIPRVKTIFGLAVPGDGKGNRSPKIKSFGAGPDGVEFFKYDDSESGGQKSKGQKSGSQKPAGQDRDNTDTSGRYVSVYQWFQTKYKINLDPAYPVVNVGNKEFPSYLPVEVCEVMRGQAYNKKLSPNQTKKMINFAVRDAERNAKSITDMGPQVVGWHSQVNTKMSTFGININTQLLTVPGRILSAPRINYDARPDGSNVFTSAASGTWNMRDVKFVQGARLGPWSFVEFYWHDDKRKATGQQAEEHLLVKVRQFASVMRVSGLQVPEPTRFQQGHMCPITSSIDGSIVNRLRLAPASQSGRFMLVIIPNKADSELYNHVKHLCDVKLGIFTQCAVSQTFMKDNNVQTWANIALKVNLKFGGTNHSLDKTKLGVIQHGETMVVGIDVTHPSPGSAKNAPSVAAMVASKSKTLGQFPAILKLQAEAKEEMVDSLTQMLDTRLDIWKANNQDKLPKNILVYRDGVSEAQYDLVLEKELPLLRKACFNKYPAGEFPKMTIIVVGKRHHTRFYPTCKKDQDTKSGSPLPGTVVDRGITESRKWDFFLQAHSALQGTARPAHYHVMFDEIFRNDKQESENFADTVEDLTHNMCYLYGRATKAVSICPPAYYADLACERARRYLGRLFDTDSDQDSATAADITVHQDLRTRMFYI